MPFKSIRIGDINVGELIDGVKIERSSNTLRIRRLNFDWFNTHNDYTYYSLKGWSGRYGKPFELMLTLHVATMAPDLVKEIAMNEKLDAKVHVKLRKSDINGQVMIDGKSIEELEREGTYDEETIKQLKEFESKNVSEIKTRIPYISSVTNHWFRNVYFEGTDSTKTGNDVDIGVDEDEDGIEDYNEARGPKTQKSRKLSASDSVYAFGDQVDTGSFNYSGDEAPDVGEGKITIEGTYSDGVVQIKDAVRGLTNKTTKELFTKKYYIYDGTVEKAERIKEAKAKNDDTMKEEVKMMNDTEIENIEQMDEGQEQSFTFSNENYKNETIFEENFSFISSPLENNFDNLSLFERKDTALLLFEKRQKDKSIKIEDILKLDNTNKKIQLEYLKIATNNLSNEKNTDNISILLEKINKCAIICDEEDYILNAFK